MDDEFEYHVRHRAYELWIDAGRPDGKHQEFWEMAEREMKAKFPADGTSEAHTDAPEGASHQE